MKNLIVLILAGLLPAIGLGQPNENWTEVNLSVTDYQVIPAYAAFDRAAQGLGRAAGGFCGDINADSLSAFRNGYHAAMDAWQGIQHIQFGPITYFYWNFRLQYWPDEKGTSARQLDDLIASADPELLSSDSFPRESVGVQGFPALERLLFEDDSLQALQADPYRCQVAQTIARNIAEIAAGVHQRWVEEFRTTVANADERGFFESAQDATVDFLKAQIEPVRRVQQQKLEAVIGEAFGRQRIRRAESWRSERSLRNLKLNVAALEHQFNGSGEDPVLLNSVLQAGDIVTINGVFADLAASLDAVPDSLAEALETEAGYDRVKTVVTNLDRLFEALEAALKNTDLYLGFNSLDGD